MSTEPLHFEECAEGMLEIIAESDLGIKELCERLEWATMQLALRRRGEARGSKARAAEDLRMNHITFVTRSQALKARYGEG